jgi:hypothetical protein
MANGLFDTDYSYLGLPRLGSAVRGPIDISQEAINNLSYLDDQAVSDPIEDEIQSYFDFPLDTVSETPTSTDINDTIASIGSVQPPISGIGTLGTPIAPEISPVFSPLPTPTPIREQPVRVTPFDPGIPNRVSNPTDSMTSRSMGLSSPIAISGSMPVSVGGTGGGIGGLPSLVRAAGSVVLPAVEKVANTGALGLPAFFGSKLIRGILDSKSSPEVTTAPVETSAPVGGALVAAMAKGAPPESVTVQNLIDTINARAASGDTDTKTALANLVRNAKAEARAAANAADTAAIQRDKAAAMNVLYGGAGSSFESGRDAYTESGQYDIDREARQAEFDRMRAARGESVKRTPAETARMLADLQSRIGFGGAMSPANAPFSTIPERVAPDPNVEYELVSGFNVPKPRETVAARNTNQGIAPFMGVPSNVRRGRARR